MRQKTKKKSCEQASSQTIQDALRLGLSDQDSETRAWARKAFWAFADHFKLESDLLLNSLDQALQGDNLSLGDRASVRSRQSSIARSNESLDSLVSLLSQLRPGTVTISRI